MKALVFFLCCAGFLMADGSGVIESHYSKSDFVLSADPNAKQWKSVKPVVADNDSFGKPAEGHRTEIRSRWTDKNLYFLFICPYKELYLKPDPSTTTETNKLWDWDVAEAFIGSDFQNIRHYREFQLSPQSEWVDLDIDRDHPKPEGGWHWNAEGYEVKARIDKDKKIWYGEMKIPVASVDSRPAKAGNEMRINLYRLQGPPPKRQFVAWQPTGQPNYHVPEAFGKIVLRK